MYLIVGISKNGMGKFQNNLASLHLCLKIEFGQNFVCANVAAFLETTVNHLMCFSNKKKWLPVPDTL